MRYFEKTAGEKLDRLKYIVKNIPGTPVNEYGNVFRDSKLTGQKSLWEPAVRSNAKNEIINPENYSKRIDTEMFSNPENYHSMPKNNNTQTKVVSDIDTSKMKKGISDAHAIKSRSRAGLIGVGGILGGAVGTAFNSDSSAAGTLVGAGAGAGAAAFATGGDTMSKLTPKVVNLFKKLRGK